MAARSAMKKLLRVSRLISLAYQRRGTVTRSELFQVGRIAIDRGIADIPLRSAFQRMQMMEALGKREHKERAAEAFAKRSRYLVLTGVIHVAPAPAPKTRKRKGVSA